MRSFGLTPDLDLFLEALPQNSFDAKAIGEGMGVSVFGDLLWIAGAVSQGWVAGGREGWTKT